jgi:prepilin-type N-terminal cleavage/methylation domain-containing protein
MRNRSSAGFTLVELLISMVLVSFFSSLILYFTFSFWRYGFSLQADEDTLTSRLNAGDIIREGIGTSAGLIIQNSLTDTHVMAPDPNNNSYWLPVHAVPGTTTVPAAGQYKPIVYYQRYSFDSAGNYIMNGNQPYQDEYVLYLDGATQSLMLRSLANPDAAGNRLKTSCPPSQSSISCPPDKTVAANLASVATRYFSRTGNGINWMSIFDTDTNSYAGPDFPAVEVVEFTLNISQKTTFEKTAGTSSTTIIRIALRNS